jgi:16S rRNA (cytidine1402-2'-O)-methyltransferase
MTAAREGGRGGVLHVVATPIGNLDDLTPRARDVLAEADLVACEDTRRTGRLYELTGIERRGRLLRLDRHTESKGVDVILAALASGASVALVSDAGTPAVSDPGAEVVAGVAAA